MENLNKYNKAFLESFGINESQLPNLKYQDIQEWDSVGHMGLMASLEETFNIEMDIDDIIDFSSYEKGKEIISKYKISFNEK
jgi:acyl carrier protein